MCYTVLYKYLEKNGKKRIMMVIYTFLRFGQVEYLIRNSNWSFPSLSRAGGEGGMCIMILGIITGFQVGREGKARKRSFIQTYNISLLSPNTRIHSSDLTIYSPFDLMVPLTGTPPAAPLTGWLPLPPTPPYPTTKAAPLPKPPYTLPTKPTATSAIIPTIHNISLTRTAAS